MGRGYQELRDEIQDFIELDLKDGDWEKEWLRDRFEELALERHNLKAEAKLSGFWYRWFKWRRGDEIYEEVATTDEGRELLDPVGIDEMDSGEESREYVSSTDRSTSRSLDIIEGRFTTYIYVPALQRFRVYMAGKEIRKPKSDMGEWIERNGLTLFSDGSEESKKAEEALKKYGLDDLYEVVESEPYQSPALTTAGNGLKRGVGEIEGFAQVVAEKRKQK